MLGLKKDTLISGSIFLVVLVVVVYLLIVSDSIIDYFYLSILIFHGICYLYVSHKKII